MDAKVRISLSRASNVLRPSSFYRLKLLWRAAPNFVMCVFRQPILVSAWLLLQLSWPIRDGSVGIQRRHLQNFRAKIHLKSNVNAGRTQQVKNFPGNGTAVGKTSIVNQKSNSCTADTDEVHLFSDSEMKGNDATYQLRNIDTGKCVNNSNAPPDKRAFKSLSPHCYPGSRQ